jgi:uncharacterized protein (DUF1778 family)
MKASKYNVQLNLRVTEQTKHDLERVAKLTNRKVSDVARQIIDEWRTN